MGIKLYYVAQLTIQPVGGYENGGHHFPTVMRALNTCVGRWVVWYVCVCTPCNNRYLVCAWSACAAPWQDAIKVTNTVG